ncbi:hypothetical protein EON67_05755 [archaeon]|nr:MAG: hypothetical protein EON67_05755 [archaeon]
MSAVGESAPPAACGLSLGQRVCDAKGFVGSVRYLGPVATSKAADTLYAGVSRTPHAHALFVMSFL